MAVTFFDAGMPKELQARFLVFACKDEPYTRIIELSLVSKRFKEIINGTQFKTQYSSLQGRSVEETRIMDAFNQQAKNDLTDTCALQIQIKSVEELKHNNYFFNRLLPVFVKYVKAAQSGIDLPKHRPSMLKNWGLQIKRLFILGMPLKQGDQSQSSTPIVLQWDMLSHFKSLIFNAAKSQVLFSDWINHGLTLNSNLIIPPKLMPINCISISNISCFVLMSSVIHDVIEQIDENYDPLIKDYKQILLNPDLKIEIREKAIELLVKTKLFREKQLQAPSSSRERSKQRYDDLKIFLETHFPAISEEKGLKRKKTDS